LDTEGKQLHSWDDIHSDDVVIIPAFGTTIETEQLLASKGVEIARYNTTCPFVEKVWKRSAEIGKSGFTIIIHGKQKHEETRATFSHSYQNAPSIIVRDLKEAETIGQFMMGKLDKAAFMEHFHSKISIGFDPETDLERVGVVNQTTMLATETQEIADYFKNIMALKYGAAEKDHFADTRDTLCYATNDNQQSTLAALESSADLAIVIGGYNSSNTSQIVTILESKFPTYFIQDASEIVNENLIRHFHYNTHSHAETTNWIPNKEPLRLLITSGASCPDTVMEEVIRRILELKPSLLSPEEGLDRFMVSEA
jgi:4-hydroxy-3-methylbut-2-enyl diphosphate reductase